jgi:hypothetical protein
MRFVPRQHRFNPFRHKFAEPCTVAGAVEHLSHGGQGSPRGS